MGKVKTKSYNKVPVVRDAGTSEATVRPMDDVCPWDAVPGPSIEHATGSTGAPHLTSSGTTLSVEGPPEDSSSSSVGLLQSVEVARASRKNSTTQLDSCSSSSDVSLAVTEVSEHLRKSCCMQHSSSVGGTTMTERSGGSGSEMIARNYSIGSAFRRVKLAEIGRPSASSYNEEPESYITKSKVLSFDRDPTMRSSAKAPVISISAIVGELGENTDESCTAMAEEEEIAEDATKTEEPDTDKSNSTNTAGKDSASPAQAETETAELLEEAQVVPVWKPDTPQSDHTAPVTQSATQQKRDNNVNEVCPWEDEENCTVDAPYVKTYATLGYL
ncbi:PREDICTED: putative protein TPRXL [Dufourea novaeangliae]|uniref:putative protein TPRXL n=1 Tax=Dufourea novaeangliae TaxID=178035 RepID=UPI0007678BF6|nr:PREDICTED: putative protein TPRXL [Dufourea novaeangliae]